MSKSLTLEFDSLPAESAECAACLTRLTQRLRALAGIESVELFRDRRRVVIDVVDAQDGFGLHCFAGRQWLCGRLPRQLANSCKW